MAFSSGSVSTAYEPVYSRKSDDKLRILMVAARYLPFAGGIETHVHETASRLQRLGHAVTIVTGNPGGLLPAFECVENVEVLRVRSWPRNSDYCFAPGFFKIIRERRWDVIHIQGYHTFSAPFALLAAFKNRIPTVLTFHSGGHSSFLRNSLRRLQHMSIAGLIRRADKLIAVSDYEANFFSRRMRIARGRFMVVPNGAALPAPSPEMKPEPEAPLIVSLGRLERYKGHHRVINAFVHLLSMIPNARLRILGDGPYESELRRLVQRLGLEERCVIGGIPPGDRRGMADLLARSSLVVLLSDYEAHPVSVMEALSLRKPVLTSNTSGFIELATRGLVRAIPLSLTPRQTADAMKDHITTTPAETPLPTWQRCTTQLVTEYRKLTHTRPADSSFHSVDVRA